MFTLMNSLIFIILVDDRRTRIPADVTLPSRLRVWKGNFRYFAQPLTVGIDRERIVRHADARIAVQGELR